MIYFTLLIESCFIVYYLINFDYSYLIKAFFNYNFHLFNHQTKPQSILMSTAQKIAEI